MSESGSFDTQTPYTQVQQRYAEGAQQRQEALCCPVDYDNSLLSALPEEITARDYGCGDPSRYVRNGDRVLDLGSGGGKICYMAAQLVGPLGRVTGVDMTDEMLALARKYQDQLAARFDGPRVEFKKGYIQDLARDLDAESARLREHPIDSPKALLAFEQWQSEQRRNRAMIADESMTLVISNCVLNLVAEQHRRQMLAEIHRVLEPGGRVAISDIVASKPVPEALKHNAELWSGCISGAFHEAVFPQAFAEAGFSMIAYDKWDQEPWQVVDGIEFRSVTLTAVKARCDTANDGDDYAVLYRGPYRETRDDFGNCYLRGQRVKVSPATYTLLTEGPAAKDFIGFGPAGSGATGDSHSSGCC